jgi:hypothetical protein
MISLFRKIRQKLLQDLPPGKAGNQITRYMVYALGEIFLVVIGILIALSINTWNENRKNAIESRFQLTKLRDDLIADKDKISSAIKRDERLIGNLIFGLKVLANDTLSTKEEFLDHFQSIYYTVNFVQTRGAFEALISSGKLQLISNQKILDSLTAYYNDNGYKPWDNSLTEYTRNIIIPYLLNFDHIPIGVDYNPVDISKSSIPGKTLTDYKQDQFIINAVRLKIQLADGQKYAYSLVQAQIDSLINTIDKELSK